MRTFRSGLVLGVLASALIPAPGQGVGPPPSAPVVAGNWRCTAFEAFLEIASAGGDRLTTLVTVPQMNVWKLPAGSTSFEDGRLLVDASALGGKLRATPAADGRMLDASWDTAQGRRELRFERVAAVPERSRGPTRPFPYREEEVSFVNERAGIRFHGTLTLPPGPGPHPAAVLVTGAGCQDRDESLGPGPDPFFKPFLIIADALTRRGIAVLRWDDRGWGQTGGSVLDSTSEDSASDALAAIRFLRQRPGIDASRVGIAGHSEGGMVALIAGSWQPDLAFVVSLAGVAQKIRPLALQTLEGWMASNRFPGILKGLGMGHLERIIKIVESDATDAEVAQKLKFMVPGQFIPSIACKWTRFMVRYDPGPAIERVRSPILGLYASEDGQVPAVANVDALRTSCARGGNKDLTIVTYSGMNHFLRYNAPPPPPRPGWDSGVAPDVLDDLGAWVVSKVRR
jgi:dienelactone hydrolase